MKQLWLVVVIPVVLGLLTAEATELAPSLARRLVRRAARWWAGKDHDRAAALGEEWEALINDCPGKLTKLLRASTFACSGAWRAQMRGVHRNARRVRRIANAVEPRRASYVLAVVSLLAAVTNLISNLMGASKTIADLAYPAAYLGASVLTVAALLMTVVWIRRRRSARRRAVQSSRLAVPAYCEGPQGTTHIRVALTRGTVTGHRVKFDPCPRCGAVHTGYVTPRRPLGSGS